MPVLKPDPSVRRRHLQDVLLLGLPFAGALWVGATTGWWLGAGFAAILLGAAGLYRQGRRFRSSLCPACGAALRRDPGEPGERVTFVCGACDTEWDTGMRDSTD